MGSLPSPSGVNPDRDVGSTTHDLLNTASHCADPLRAKELRDEAVLLNQPLARRIAHRYRWRGIDSDDLDQVALLGLCKAVLGYDPASGPRFLGFANATISGELKRHFRDHGWLVRPPRAVQETLALIRTNIPALEQLSGRTLSPSEYAAALGCTPGAVGAALLAEPAYAVVSLDAAPESQGAIARRDHHAAYDQSELARLEDLIVLRPAVQRLSEREQTVLRLRFGEELTQSQIGDVIGVSQMQVSRILRRALAQLRSELTGSLDTSEASPRTIAIATSA